MTTAEMDNLVKVRMGEALEEELRKDANFQQRQKEWRNASKEFDSMVSMTQEQWFAFERVEDVFLSYNSAYGEAAYKMGLSDGIQIRREQEPNGRKSFLTFEDMTRLISVYDAVRELKKVLLGSVDEHWEEAGAFRVFEQIFDVINSATSAKIKFLGDEMIDKIISILNDETMRPEERAKQLLGME